MNILCNNCGQDIPDPGTTIRFITCTNCQSKLEIIRTTESVFTKIFQKPTGDDRITKVELKVELERLAREWEEEKAEKFMLSDKYGEKLINDQAIKSNRNALNFMGGLAFIALVVMAVFNNDGSLILLGAMMLLMALFIILISFFRSQSLTQKMIDYEQAKARYEQKKQKITDQINGN